MSERPPPSPAQVALALAAIGRVDAAHVLLEIALDEDAGDEECSEAHERLARLDREPLAPEETPRVFLGLPLVDAYVQSGLVREAQVIAQALWSTNPDDAGAARRVRLLDRLLAPLPAGASSDVVTADGLLREGAVASAMLAYREAGLRPGCPGWVRDRVEALRGLVLSREQGEGSPRRAVSQTDDTTRVGRDPRRIVALLLERNLAGAAEEAHLAASTHGGELAELAEALRHLMEAADRVPRDSPESRSTLPMGRRGVADLHVRMASFEQATLLYRSAVEADPNDDDARRALEALRVVTRHLRGVTVEQVDSVAVTALPESEATRPRLRVAPPGETENGETPVSDLRAVAYAASRIPEAALAQTGELLLDVEAADGEPEGSSAVVEQTLHKTGQRAPAGSWALASGSRSLRGTLEDDTAITSPEVAAELALRQGYPERALAVYRELARAHPDQARFAQRVSDIERTLGLVVEPPSSTTSPTGAVQAPSAVQLVGRAVRSPTGPYRSLGRGAPGGSRVAVPGPGPTRSPGDPAAALPAAERVVSLPDLVPTVIATSDVERARSPFDGIDDEETAVNLEASELVRDGLRVGPERAPVSSAELPPVPTRVDDMPPPTVRLPGVAEALARNMAHAGRGEPAPGPAARPAAGRDVAAALGASITEEDDLPPPTVRLEPSELAAIASEARDPAPAPQDEARPAVAARRIIPVGE